MAVSPDGSKVFVTGFSYARTGLFDYATVSYDAATGRRLWVARYSRSETRSTCNGVVHGGL